MLLNTLDLYISFTRLLESLLTPLDYLLANSLLLVIEAVSELNSYLLIFINALEDS